MFARYKLKWNHLKKNRATEEKFSKWIDVDGERSYAVSQLYQDSVGIEENGIKIKTWLLPVMEIVVSASARSDKKFHSIYYFHCRFCFKNFFLSPPFTCRTIKFWFNFTCHLARSFLCIALLSFRLKHAMLLLLVVDVPLLFDWQKLLIVFHVQSFCVPIRASERERESGWAGERERQRDCVYGT